MSLTPKPQAVEDGDDGDDDFSQLDIPDIPPTSIGNMEYPPPRLVDRSLPTNFIVADALDPFDPPLPENDGCCRSKYTAQDGSSTFLNSIRDTRHWQEFKSDPIFAFVHTNRQVIPLDVILSTYQSSYEDVEHGQAQAEGGGWSGDARPSVGREEAKEVMDRLDHPVRAEEPANNSAAVPYTVSRDHKNQSGSSNYGRLNGLPDGARPPWGLPPQPEFSAYGKRDRPDEETTASQWPAKLARIGRIVSRTCPPPPAMPESPTDSPEVVASPPRSRTPSMFELYVELTRAAYLGFCADPTIAMNIPNKTRPLAMHSTQHSTAMECRETPMLVCQIPSNPRRHHPQRACIDQRLLMALVIVH